MPRVKLTHSLVTTAANELTKISWVICFMQRSNLPADAVLPRSLPQREELAVISAVSACPFLKAFGLLTFCPAEHTPINMQFYNFINDCGLGQYTDPLRIIKRQFGFVKARYKGLLKNDKQPAMLFTLANLFRVDQMIRKWERSQ
jgi:IS5 family transposase